MKNIKKLLVIIGAFLFLNSWATSIIQRFNCPKMSETELMIELPNNFVYKFKECE